MAGKLEGMSKLKGKKKKKDGTILKEDVEGGETESQ